MIKKYRIPRIDIRYGRFLSPIFNCYVQQNNPTVTIPKNEKILTNIKQQQSNWNEVDEIVLIEIQKITGLTFLENTIPVYIVPTYEGAFSDPIVISSLQTERFVDLLTHELIHRLSDYNNENISIRDVGKALYTNVDDSTLRDHIFVHAVHTYLYLDTLNTPQSLKHDIASSEGAYADAWKLVQEDGYKEVIQRYKDHY